MAVPDSRVASIVGTILVTEWDTNATEFPDDFSLRNRQTGTGDPRKSVDPGADDYLLINETGERGDEYADLGRHSQHFTAQVFIEYATTEGRQRREAVLGEVRRIFRENNHRRIAASAFGSPLGGWDTLDYSVTVPKEEIFDFDVIEFSVDLSASSRVY